MCTHVHLLLLGQLEKNRTRAAAAAVVMAEQAAPWLLSVSLYEYCPASCVLLDHVSYVYIGSTWALCCPLIKGPSSSISRIRQFKIGVVKLLSHVGTKLLSWKGNLTTSLFLLHMLCFLFLNIFYQNISPLISANITLTLLVQTKKKQKTKPSEPKLP